MKKLLFSAYTMDVGGIETALLSLLNELIKKYEITLVLEKKQGVFLKDLDKKIKVIEYTPSNNKIVLIRKFINLIKRIKFTLKYKNKFDFAASYATYSRPGSFCARIASENNCLWIHSDYLGVYENKTNEMIEFFESVEYNKFSKIITVANRAKHSFMQVFKDYKKSIYVINNLIDYKKILEKAEEKIELEKDECTTFLNVSRHDEHAKKLTRLINVCEKLKNENYKFKVLFVGQGHSTELYKQLIEEKELQEYILMIGSKENPYPYFEISDSVILTSDYEGYPVVFVESMVLNKSIITTDVSDAKIDIEGKFGIVTEKTEEAIYEAMKSFIDNNYEIKQKFNPEEFNKEILRKIEEVINA